MSDQQDPAHEHEPAYDRRLEALEARMNHLEAELEGLQDAVYRRARRDDERLDQLDQRTQPDQMSRALEDDVRRRGL